PAAPARELDPLRAIARNALAVEVELAQRRAAVGVAPLTAVPVEDGRARRVLRDAAALLREHARVGAAHRVARLARALVERDGARLVLRDARAVAVGHR